MIQKDETLWLIKDIAAHLKYKSNTLLKNVVCQDDFPRPVRITEQRGRRWYRVEVLAWCRSKQEKR